jgi:hypothetical protein
MSNRTEQDAPIVDADGNPVDATGLAVTPELRAFFAGRVPAKDCPHYIAGSERRAGFTRCERC